MCFASATSLNEIPFQAEDVLREEAEAEAEAEEEEEEEEEIDCAAATQTRGGGTVEM